jgi:carboxyl-terminal processing protease
VLKRFLSILLGMLVGSILAMGLLHLALLIGLVGDREVTASSRYYRDVLNLVQERYVDAEAVEPEEMTRDALRGMLQGLDAHSDFMDESAYEHLQEDIDSEFGGIGVQIEFRDGFVVVIAPISGTPGEEAGVLRGDRVIAVDGESMAGRSINDVVNRLRGEPGSEVEIAFDRPGQDDPFEVTIIREVIEVESVADVMMLTERLGYVRVVQFSEPTVEEFQAAVHELQQQGMEALVIDLRNNPGGLLGTALDMLEPYFSAGELMAYTEGRRPADREEYRSSNEGEVWAFPQAVLINGGSASASELMAGALKDTDRAVIVGETSFGKGSVQSVLRLRDGEALRLTTARFYTPGGETLHEAGVTPDIAITMTPEDDLNLALQRNRRDLVDPVEFEERFGFAPIVDKQLEAAIEALSDELEEPPSL